MGGGQLTPGQVITCCDCGDTTARTGRNQIRCAPCREAGKGARCYASRKRRGKTLTDRVRRQSINHGGTVVPHGTPCEICGQHRPLVVDHDHSCCPARNKSCGRCVRGFLCRQCNSAIGALGDDVEGLSRALVYLTRTRA